MTGMTPVRPFSQHPSTFITSPAPLLRPLNTATQASVRFSGVPVSQTESLLTILPNQQRFLNQMDSLLGPFGVNEVQHWDETKTPPLPVLKAFTDAGVFVNGVPIPTMETGNALLNSPAFRQVFQTTQKEDKLNALDALMANPAKRDETRPFLEALGQEGYAKAMTLASMRIPMKTSVGVGTFLGVNNGLSAQTISKIGTPEQQAIWLNALNHGIFTYGFGLTEEKVGSDPGSMETTFKKVVDEKGQVFYQLNGNKKFIGNAARVVDKDGKVIHPGADFLAVYAVDDPKKAPKQRSYRVFMVPRQLIGEENIHSSGYDHNKMGLREVNNGDFELKNVMVPEALMLGKPDENIYKKMLGLLDITRLFVGAMGLGQTEACLKEAKAYAAKRVQNGGPIEKHQMVSFPLRIAEAKATAGQLLLMEASRMVDAAAAQQAQGKEGDRFGLETAMAKLFCTELAEETARQAVDTLGGNGFIEDPKQGLGLAKRLRDTKVLTIYEGTSNIQRNVIAGSIMLSEMKKMVNDRDFRKGLRFFLFGKSYKLGPLNVRMPLSSFTKRLHYRVLKNTSFSPVNKVNAAFQFALINVVEDYSKSLNRVIQEWEKNGVPAEYAGWDAESIKRQQNLIATRPVQYRMGLLADMAVYRKLLHLSLNQLALLDKKSQLTPEETKLQKDLRLFEKIALDTVIEKGRKIGSGVVKTLESESQ